jgi:hypothetical protein
LIIDLNVALVIGSPLLGKWTFAMDFSVFFPLFEGKAGIFVVLGGVFS